MDPATHPSLACFYAAPAYFLWSDPDSQDVAPLFQMFSADCWIIPSSEKWEHHLTAYFGEKLTSYPRTSFNSASLNLAHLRSLKREPPSGLQIVPIGETHVTNEDGMLYQDLLGRFFSQANFLQQGAGFCLLEGEKMIGFADANYPIRNKILEVYIRVDYNDDPRHRQQGLGRS